MISESKLSKKEPNNNIIFENRAWEEAEHPRLHMKEPETFIHTKIENFNPKETEMKFFSSVKEIVEYIKKTYKKAPILPKKWR